MSFNNTDGNNGKYSAQFRKDAKTENKNGQNIVSHTSIIEQGRLAKHTRDIAKMYEEMDTSKDCPVHSRINRPCDCEG